MSGILGGYALGGVGVGDWPYTLGAGLYSGGVAGCWLCNLALHHHQDCQTSSNLSRHPSQTVTQAHHNVVVEERFSRQSTVTPLAHRQANSSLISSRRHLQDNTPLLLDMQRPPTSLLSWNNSRHRPSMQSSIPPLVPPLSTGTSCSHKALVSTNAL